MRIFKPPEGYTGNGILIDEDTTRDNNIASMEMISEMWRLAKEPLVQEINGLKSRVGLNELEIKEVKQQVNELSVKVDNVGIEVIGVKSDVEELKKDMAENFYKMEKTINENSNQLKVMGENVSALLGAFREFTNKK